MKNKIILIILAVFLISFVSALSVDNNTVALWSLDEGSGINIIDSTGNGNDGTIHGATWVNGISGKALSFDGVDDYVDAGNDSSLDLTPIGMSIGAWVYNNAQIIPREIDFRTIVARRGSSENGYGLSYGYYTRDGASIGYRIDILFYGGYQGTANYEILPGQWYHIVGVFKNNIGTIYINGNPLPTTNILNGYANTNTDMIIGRQGDYNRQDYNNGIIDEIIIYNRSLTAEEVKNLYISQLPEPPQPTLEDRVNLLESQVEDLTARVTLLETLINKINNWFWFMPNSVKKDILCSTLEETGGTEIVDFGIWCEIKELRNKDVCVCKKV